MEKIGERATERDNPAASAMTGPDQIVHAQTQSLLAYWQGLRTDGGLPRRGQIDPRQMRCDVASLFIVEVLEDGSQRFRVAGSRIIDTFGMELRGVAVRSLIEAHARPPFTAFVGEVLDKPGIGYARLLSAGGGLGVWEMLLLPLRSDNGRLDRIIGCMNRLAGGHSNEKLVPLRLDIDRLRVWPIAEIEDIGEGLAEDGTPFQLTAIEGGREAPAGSRRNSPPLRLIEGD